MVKNLISVSLLSNRVNPFSFFPCYLEPHNLAKVNLSRHGCWLSRLFVKGCLYRPSLYREV